MADNSNQWWEATLGPFMLSKHYYDKETRDAFMDMRPNREEPAAQSNWLEEEEEPRGLWDRMFGVWDEDEAEKNIKSLKRGIDDGSKNKETMGFKYGDKRLFDPYAVGKGIASGELKLVGQDLFRTYSKNGKLETELIPVATLTDTGKTKPVTYMDMEMPTWLGGRNFDTEARKMTGKQYKDESGAIGNAIQSVASGFTRPFVDPLVDMFTSGDGRTSSVYSAQDAQGESNQLFELGGSMLGMIGGIKAAAGIAPKLLNTGAKAGAAFGLVAEAPRALDNIISENANPFGESIKALANIGTNALAGKWGAKATQQIAGDLAEGALKQAMGKVGLEILKQTGIAGVQTAADLASTMTHDSYLQQQMGMKTDPDWMKVALENGGMLLAMNVGSELLGFGNAGGFGAIPKHYRWNIDKFRDANLLKMQKFAEAQVKKNPNMSTEQVLASIELAKQKRIVKDDKGAGYFHAILERYRDPEYNVKIANKILDMAASKFGKESIMKHLEDSNLIIFEGERKQRADVVDHALQMAEANPGKTFRYEKIGDNQWSLITEDITDKARPQNNVVDRITGDIPRVAGNNDKPLSNRQQNFGQVQSTLDENGRVMLHDNDFKILSAYLETQIMKNNAFAPIAKILKDIVSFTTSIEGGQVKAKVTNEGIKQFVDLFTEITGKSPVGAFRSDVVDTVVNYLAGMQMRHDFTTNPSKFIDVVAQSGKYEVPILPTHKILAAADKKALYLIIEKSLGGFSASDKSQIIANKLKIKINPSKDIIDQFVKATEKMTYRELYEAFPDVLPKMSAPKTTGSQAGSESAKTDNTPTGPVDAANEPKLLSPTKIVDDATEVPDVRTLGGEAELAPAFRAEEPTFNIPAGADPSEYSRMKDLEIDVQNGKFDIPNPTHNYDAVFSRSEAVSPPPAAPGPPQTPEGIAGDFTATSQAFKDGRLNADEAIDMMTILREEAEALGEQGQHLIRPIDESISVIDLHKRGRADKADVDELLDIHSEEIVKPQGERRLYDMYDEKQTAQQATDEVEEPVAPQPIKETVVEEPPTIEDIKTEDVKAEEVKAGEVPPKTESNPVQTDQIGEPLSRKKSMEPMTAEPEAKPVEVIKAKNKDDLEQVVYRKFGVKKKKHAKAIAAVGDRIVKSIARELGVSESEAYQKIGFASSNDAGDLQMRILRVDNDDYQYFDVAKLEGGLRGMFYGWGAYFTNTAQVAKRYFGIYDKRVGPYKFILRQDAFPSDLAEDARWLFTARRIEPPRRIDGKASEDFNRATTVLTKLLPRLMVLVKEADQHGHETLPLFRYRQPDTSFSRNLQRAARVLMNSDQAGDLASSAKRLHDWLNNPLNSKKLYNYLREVPTEKAPRTHQFDAPDDIKLLDLDKQYGVDAEFTAAIDKVIKKMNDDIADYGSVGDILTPERLQSYYQDFINNYIPGNLRVRYTRSPGAGMIAFLSEYYRNFGPTAKMPRGEAKSYIAYWLRQEGYQGFSYYPDELRISTGHPDQVSHANPRNLVIFDEEVLSDMPDLKYQLRQMTGTGEVLGSVKFLKDGEAIVNAAQNANGLTFLHELTHIYGENMGQADRDIVIAASGQSAWNREAREFFAEQAEIYFTKGQTNNKEMQGVLSKVKSFIQDIYHALRGDAQVEVHPDVKQVLDRMMGHEAPKATDTNVPPTRNLADGVDDTPRTTVDQSTTPDSSAPSAVKGVEVEEKVTDEAPAIKQEEAEPIPEAKDEVVESVDEKVQIDKAIEDGNAKLREDEQLEENIPTAYRPAEITQLNAIAIAMEDASPVVREAIDKFLATKKLDPDEPFAAESAIKKELDLGLDNSELEPFREQMSSGKLKYGKAATLRMDMADQGKSKQEVDAAVSNLLRSESEKRKGKQVLKQTDEEIAAIEKELEAIQKEEVGDTTAPVDEDIVMVSGKAIRTKGISDVLVDRQASITQSIEEFQSKITELETRLKSATGADYKNTKAEIDDARAELKAAKEAQAKIQKNLNSDGKKKQTGKATPIQLKKQAEASVHGKVASQLDEPRMVYSGDDGTIVIQKRIADGEERVVAVWDGTSSITGRDNPHSKLVKLAQADELLGITENDLGDLFGRNSTGQVKAMGGMKEIILGKGQPGAAAPAQQGSGVVRTRIKKIIPVEIDGLAMLKGEDATPAVKGVEQEKQPVAVEEQPSQPVEAKRVTFYDGKQANAIELEIDLNQVDPRHREHVEALINELSGHEDDLAAALDELAVLPSNKADDLEAVKTANKDIDKQINDLKAEEAALRYDKTKTSEEKKARLAEIKEQRIALKESKSSAQDVRDEYDSALQGHKEDYKQALASAKKTIRKIEKLTGKKFTEAKQRSISDEKAAQIEMNKMMSAPMAVGFAAGLVQAGLPDDKEYDSLRYMLGGLSSLAFGYGAIKYIGNKALANKNGLGRFLEKHHLDRMIGTGKSLDRQYQKEVQAITLNNLEPKQRETARARIAMYKVQAKDLLTKTTKLGRTLSHMPGAIAQELKRAGADGVFRKDKALTDLGRKQDAFEKGIHSLGDKDRTLVRAILVKTNDDIFTNASRINNELLMTTEEKRAVIEAMDTDENIKHVLAKNGIAAAHLDEALAMYKSMREYVNQLSYHDIDSVCRDKHGFGLDEVATKSAETTEQYLALRDQLSELRNELREHKKNVRKRDEFKELSTKRKRDRYMKRDITVADLSNRLNAIKDQLRSVRNMLNALDYAEEFMDMSKKINYMPGRWAHKMSSGDYGLSFYEIDPLTHKRVHQNYSIYPAEMQVFKDMDQRTAYLDDWLKKHSAEVVEFDDGKKLTNVRKITYEKDGKMHQVLVQINDQIDFSRNKELLHGAVTQLRKHFLILSKNQMDFNTMKTGLLKSIESMRKSHADDTDFAADYDAGNIDYVVDNLKRIVNESSDEYLLVSGMQRIFDHVLKPKASPMIRNKNVRGYEPAEMSDWNKVFDAGVQQITNKMGAKYVTTALRDGIERQLIEVNSLGINNEYTSWLKDMYDDILYRQESVDYEKRAIPEGVMQAMKVADTLGTIGVMGLNLASGVRNVVMGMVTATSGMVAQGHNPMKLASAAYGLSKSKGKADVAPYADPNLNLIHKQIIESGIPASSAVKSMDDYTSTLKTKRLIDKAFAVMHATEYANRYVTSMAYAMAHLAENPPVGKLGKEYLDNLTADAALFTWGTQGNFDFMYRTDVEKLLLRKVPLGHMFLRLQAPAINSLAMYTNLVKTATMASGTAKRKAAAGFLAMTALSFLVGGAETVPFVGDAAALGDLYGSIVDGEEGDPSAIRDMQGAIADQMRKQGVDEKTIDFMITTYRKGFLSALTDTDFSMEAAAHTMFTPFLAQVIYKTFKDAPKAFDEGFADGVLTLFEKRFVAPGRVLQAGRQLAEGEYLDNKGNKMNREYGVDDFARGAVFGKTAKDRMASEDEMFDTPGLNTPQEERAFAERLFTRNMKFDGLKGKRAAELKEAAATDPTVMKHIDKIEQSFRSKLNSKQMQNVIEKNVAKAEKITKRYKPIADKLRKGEYYGSNEDAASLDASVATSVERYYEAMAMVETANPILQAQYNISGSLSYDKDPSNDLGKYIPGEKHLSAYPPTQRGAVYAIIKYFKELEENGYEF